MVTDFSGHPAIQGNEMQLGGPDRPKDSFLMAPDPIRKVIRIAGSQLRTRPAPGLVPAAAFIHMAASRHRIHICQAPYNRRVPGHDGKEGFVIQIARNPVQIDDVACWNLADKIIATLASRIAEDFAAGRA
jgi:hypothetical protein